MRKSSQAQRKIALKMAIKAHPLIENDVRALAMIEQKFKIITTVKAEERIKESDYLTPNEIEGILDNLYREDTFRSVRMAILVETLYQSACRISELLAVTHNDVNVLKDRVEIKVLGKGSKMRTVFISNLTYELIRSHFSKRDHLFTNEQGTPMTRHGVHKSITALTKKHVGRKLGPHALRHSKAMEMLGRGVGIKKVSSYLGHSDVATTLRYYVHETANHGDVLG
jgi:integrase/recombinase XerD